MTHGELPNLALFYLKHPEPPHRRYQAWQKQNISPSITILGSERCRDSTIAVEAIHNTRHWRLGEEGISNLKGTEEVEFITQLDHQLV